MTELSQFNPAVLVGMALAGIVQEAFCLLAYIQLCEQKHTEGREEPRKDMILFTRTPCNTTCRSVNRTFGWENTSCCGYMRQ